MPNMSDDVRKHATDHYVKPARTTGKKDLRIRVGDVHKALGFRDKLPLVCGALSAKKFWEPNRLKLTGIEGPGQSTTTTYVFEVL